VFAKVGMQSICPVLTWRSNLRLRFRLELVGADLEGDVRGKDRLVLAVKGEVAGRAASFGNVHLEVNTGVKRSEGI